MRIGRNGQNETIFGFVNSTLNEILSPIRWVSELNILITSVYKPMKRNSMLGYRGVRNEIDGGGIIKDTPSWLPINVPIGGIHTRIGLGESTAFCPSSGVTLLSVRCSGGTPLIGFIGAFLEETAPGLSVNT